MELKRELPDWISGWLEYMSNSEAPTIYNKWVAVSLIASALERRVYLRWDKSIYTNFYIVLVGPAALSRKGTSMGPGRDLLSEISVKVGADVTTKERLSDVLQESSDSYQDDLGQLQTHASLTIYSEEFTVFLGYGNQDIMPWLCDWYDCKKRWSYETRHQADVSLDNIWLNIIGATTPELLQDVLPRESFGSGLNSRIIYVYADKRERVVLFPFATEGQEELWKKLSTDLQIMKLWNGEFTPTESYLEKWRDWYPQQHNIKLSEDARMSGYVGRRPTHLHKLTMVVNASRDGKMELTAEDFDRGLSILEETETRMQRTFAGVGRSGIAPIMNMVLAFVRAKGTTKFSAIQNQFKFDADKKELSLAIATLESAKLLKVDYKEGDRDCTIEYALNRLTSPSDQNSLDSPEVP